MKLSSKCNLGYFCECTRVKALLVVSPCIICVFCGLIICVLLPVLSQVVVGVLRVQGVLCGSHRAVVVVGMRQIRLLWFVLPW